MSDAYDPAVLKADLTRDEGRAVSLYPDTTGHLTGGIGHNFSIPMAPQVIDAIYASDIQGCEASLDHRVPWWRDLDAVRQLVMMNMMFNLGGAKLAGFPKFLAAMQAGDWDEAAVQMMNSAWARQVGSRATRLRELVLTGVSP